MKTTRRTVCRRPGLHPVIAFDDQELADLTKLLPASARAALPALQEQLEIEARVLVEAARRPAARDVRADLLACAAEIGVLRSRLCAQMTGWEAPHLAAGSQTVLGDPCAVDALIARISADLSRVAAIQRSAAKAMAIRIGRKRAPRSYLTVVQRFLAAHGMHATRGNETSFVEIVSICAAALTRATGVTLKAEWIARDFDADEREERHIENVLVSSST